MTKYFIDTEFIEGKQKKLFGYTKPTIDLISIGIVSDDDREYYAISKEFNLREAWNRWQLDDVNCPIEGTFYKKEKTYWLRDNVLKQIFDDLFSRFVKEPDYRGCVDMDFNYSNLKYLINIYGKPNKQISEEIISFVFPSKDSAMDDWDKVDTPLSFDEWYKEKYNPEFYAYFADYDWVGFCWLFGNMNDLPEKFPMYCRDLKQIYDDKERFLPYASNHFGVTDIMKLPNFPKLNRKEHNALDDAKWNKQLYEFLIKV